MTAERKKRKRIAPLDVLPLLGEADGMARWSMTRSGQMENASRI
jgi:hypothetical protein